MVVKPCGSLRGAATRFESSVIPYGSQTVRLWAWPLVLFESSVIPYGSQTGLSTPHAGKSFESSVIPYGSQTVRTRP